MAQDRPNQTVMDYVTIVLSPVLIMGLVGSLVFFLLEVLYKTDGPWKQRLQWIFFFYVFGAVLVGRISMIGEIADRAGLYAALLGFAAYMGMQSYVEYPPGLGPLSWLVNLFIIVVVWWCSHKLVWDCTNVDEDTDMSGQGLLHAAGIEDEPKKQESEEDEVIEATVDDGKTTTAIAWWERYQRWKQQQNKKRTLGVWVVYFSLAALPIYGLGQSLIPLTAPDRRQFAFWLMTVYVGCGLGLLLTTCFLGLRRYLRQKRLQMPAAMTGMWLTMGAGIVVTLLLVGALMPRPYAEYPLMDFFDPAGSKKRQASQMALKGDSPAEGEGRPGEAQPDGKQPGDRTGEKGKGDGQGKNKDGKSGKGEEKGGGRGKKSENSSGSNSDKDGKKGDGENRDQGKNQAKGDQRKGNSGSQPKNNDKGEQKGDQQGKGSSNPPSSSSSALQQLLQRISPILKWIVFIVFVVIVIIAIIRGAVGFLANFTDWAKRLVDAWRKFWENLFGSKSTVAGGSEEADDEDYAGDPGVPFSAFADPFESGEAGGMSSRELVRYTYRAVEAWAREQGLDRGPDETAMEFLTRLAEEVPALEVSTRNLANLHARAEYAQGGLPTNTSEILQAVWKKLNRVNTAPMSA